jgi:hypothetical protein
VIPDLDTEFLHIDADLRGLKDVAAALLAELAHNYLPYRDRVDADLTVPSTAPDFPELLQFLARHRDSQQVATALLAEHGNATGALAYAADLIATRYGDTDGLAAARARDVERLLS